MKLKQRPEDFSVKESYRFDEDIDGRYRVYLMDKQKLSTFDAVARIAKKFGLKPGAVSFCGLKDKQGRTEQLIAVEGVDVDMQDPDLRLKFLGRAAEPLTAANTTSNRFAVTVRQLREQELQDVTMAVSEVGRLGVVNYFDNQRFGSIKHGQGFIAKDLLKGDFERALRNYMAVPSPLDRTDDAKVKGFWAEHWGDWRAHCPYQTANTKYARILHVLRRAPRNFLEAFLTIDSKYRALLLFEFQSYLWNESARRLLQLVLPRESLFVMPYQAGSLLHHRDARPELLAWMRQATVPLLAPSTTIADPRVKEAVDWALGKEKLTLEQLTVKEAPRLLFFKHEERPLLVQPQKLVIGKAGRDELNRGFMKVNVAFTLPPGSYATLVVKRLFHFGVEQLEREAKERPAPRPDAGESSDASDTPAQVARQDKGRHRDRPRPTDAPVGFRARQQQKKQAKAAARAAQPAK
ncbi:MAG: tRNA pseudouridine(13) synthase TruD [Myxococcaceae bacterium]|jgi:tRNA pseudouridine13 synthase|nr:tRNA pseudouridine(13) synthase TruD [Myxococcaceae bacterium]